MQTSEKLFKWQSEAELGTTAHTIWKDTVMCDLPGPSRGGKGGSFPGPRDVWGPRHRSKILKRVFHMASF